MTQTESYTQPAGCPLCGAPEWVRVDDGGWMRCVECGVQYVLEDVEAKLEESRR